MNVLCNVEYPSQWQYLISKLGGRKVDQTEPIENQTDTKVI